MRRFIVCCTVLALCMTAAAQQSSTSRQFEVASIKPAAQLAAGSINLAALTPPPPDQWKATNLTLQQLIENTHPEYGFSGLIASEN